MMSSLRVPRYYYLSAICSPAIMRAPAPRRVPTTVPRASHSARSLCIIRRDNISAQTAAAILFAKLYVSSERTAVSGPPPHSSARVSGRFEPACVCQHNNNIMIWYVVRGGGAYCTHTHTHTIIVEMCLARLSSRARPVARKRPRRPSLVPFQLRTVLRVILCVYTHTPIRMYTRIYVYIDLSKFLFFDEYI